MKINDRHPLILDLKSVKAFITLIEEGTVQKTAETMGLSAASISQTIKSLEETLRTTLLDRSVRPLRPTMAGRILQERGRELLLLSDTTCASIHRLNPSELVLRLGMSEAISAAFSPYVIAGLTGDFLGLDVQTGMTEALKNKFLNNELDVLISSEPFDDQTVERYFLFRERFYLVMPSGQKQNLTMPLLKKVAQELPYIRYNNESIDRRQTEMIYRLLHIRQKKQIKVESSFAMTGLIALGKGWAVMPPLSLWQGRDFIDSLSVHPMPDVTINREFWIVSHSKAWSEACEKIRHTIVRCFDEGFAQRLNALNNRLTVKW